ncbi:MAG: acetylxylan esterase [Planctomycetes bacterium]|nr:acetylxylan esterase [Planctomycetota bacterium]
MSNTWHRAVCGVFVVSVVGLMASRVAAESGRVLPAGKLPADRRLEPLKTLDGYFPFEVPKSVAEWQDRADVVRRQVLVSQGLWPMPTRTPARAVVHGRVAEDGYTVERVYLQSYPGHFVTGSLYRPAKGEGPFPAVLCPHGHWPNGRFMDVERAKVEKDVEAGAEKYVDNGRNVLQSRSKQLARMGCIVFLYDMVGYADSQQITHRPGVRAAMSTETNWGYFSPQAELRMQNMMGLQTYNSLCALDWICSLPEVDTDRIGVTGASGGGTQTFILCAIDSRITVAHPAVMVSTAMQGGCTCENAPHLRVGSGNIELAALFAPKPLSMTAANDWTKEIATKGLPELQQLYGLLGARENVQGVPYLQFPHNYNAPSRLVMYGWFNKHLRLGQSEPIEEPEFRHLTEAETTVWNESHPKPPSGDDYERSLLRWLTADGEAQLARLAPYSPDDLPHWRNVVGEGWATLIGRELPAAAEVEHEKLAQHDRGTYQEIASLLRVRKHGEEIPVMFMLPANWNKQVVLWIDGQGKRALYAADGAPTAEVKQLLDAGTAVAGIDVFGQGEFTADGQPVTKQRLVVGPKVSDISKYAGYTYGYNHSLLAQRAHDLLALITYVRNRKLQPQRVTMVARNGAAPYVAAACAVAGSAVDALAIDTHGFRFARLTEFDDVNFVPGAVKYGDLPGLLTLAAPAEMWVTGETSYSILPVANVYNGPGQRERFQFAPEADKAALMKWLLK